MNGLKRALYWLGMKDTFEDMKLAASADAHFVELRELMLKIRKLDPTIRRITLKVDPHDEDEVVIEVEGP